jgi:hypothetical protein
MEKTQKKNQIDGFFLLFFFLKKKTELQYQTVQIH